MLPGQNAITKTAQTRKETVFEKKLLLNIFINTRLDRFYELAVIYFRKMNFQMIYELYKNKKAGVSKNSSLEFCKQI